MHTFQSFANPIPNNLTLTKDDTSVENSLSLKWKLCEKERYYNVYLQPTLFGGWSVVKSWGATRSKLGNYKFRVFDDLKNAHIEIEKIRKQRLARGYARVALEEIHNVTDE